MCISLLLKHTSHILQNTTGDARTPQPREIVFDTMRYRRSEAVKRSGNFQGKQCHLCQGLNIG